MGIDIEIESGKEQVATSAEEIESGRPYPDSVQKDCDRVDRFIGCVLGERVMRERMYGMESGGLEGSELG
nr:hypothetical protein [Tanacetum cinerariifolium]